jgi:hypothetical protein
MASYQRRDGGTRYILVIVAPAPVTVACSALCQVFKEWLTDANTFLAFNRVLLLVRNFRFLSAVAREKLSWCKPVFRAGSQCFRPRWHVYWARLSRVLRLGSCLVGSHCHICYWSCSVNARLHY